ncbi:MAG TPA: DUF4350 domain-containing protein [Leucothrix sp.]|nr:DUF4350 domain-containing protein [Leucothrix sp.]
MSAGLSNRTATLLIVLLVALIIGAGVYNFYKTHEYKEVEIRTGLLNEARTNPFYASRLFLKRMGIPTIKKESLQTNWGFPNTDTVMIITTKRKGLSTARTEELLEWVESGGHLIARSTSDWYYSGDGGDEETEEEINKMLSDKDSRDPLQRLLGIHSGKRIHLSEDVNKEKDKKKKKIKSDAEEIMTALLETKVDETPEYEISIKGADAPLKIQMDWFENLVIDDLDKSASYQTEQVKLKTGNFIIRTKVGEGLVTLVSDMDFFKNYEIEKSDHAKILWHLVHGYQTDIQQPKTVWLIHDDEMASLWNLLWKNAWTLILSLTLFLALWMLQASRRFGPVIPKQQEDRRSLNEHITSSGNYYWKNNKKHRLIESSRLALTQRLTRVHPGWANYSREEQIKLLSNQLNMPSEALHRLLYDNNFEQGDDFTWLVQQLEKVRKSI